MYAQSRCFCVILLWWLVWLFQNIGFQRVTIVSYYGCPIYYQENSLLLCWMPFGHVADYIVGAICYFVSLYSCLALSRSRRADCSGFTTLLALSSHQTCQDLSQIDFIADYCILIEYFYFPVQCYLLGRWVVNILELEYKVCSHWSVARSIFTLLSVWKK